MWLVSSATGLIAPWPRSSAVGVAITSAATSALITDLSRRARYGTAHGVFGTIHDVGDAWTTVAGLLVASVGYTRMFQIMAFVALIVAGAFWLVSRRAHGPLNQDEAVTS